jgi:hypothetical protein
MKPVARCGLELGLALSLISVAGDVTAASAGAPSLVADRAAVERVYYQHRRGGTAPFEQVLPRAEIERLVKLDVKKEAVLKRVYRTEIVQSEIDAEAERIAATTRAPEVLAEVKAVLGNDPQRFGAVVARPIVVERKLRSLFNNDDQLHATQRRQADEVRRAVLASQGLAERIAALRAAQSGAFAETTWQLTARGQPLDVARATAVEKTAALRSASYSIEAKVERAAAVDEAVPEPQFFGDLNPELQEVLRAQLRRSGDVSAVIETPGAFLLFVAQEASADVLRVASLTLSKRDYDRWLDEQPD